MSLFTGEDEADQHAATKRYARSTAAAEASAAQQRVAAEEIDLLLQSARSIEMNSKCNNETRSANNNVREVIRQHRISIASYRSIYRHSLSTRSLASFITSSRSYLFNFTISRRSRSIEAFLQLLLRSKYEFITTAV